jgi:hypothetical protein
VRQYRYIPKLVNDIKFEQGDKPGTASRVEQAAYEAGKKMVVAQQNAKVMEHARTANLLAKSLRGKARIHAYAIKTEARLGLCAKFPQQVTTSQGRSRNWKRRLAEFYAPGPISGKRRFPRIGSLPDFFFPDFCQTFEEALPLRAA